MNCQNCPNWNKELKTCKLNPDVKRDKNNSCMLCPECGEYFLYRVGVLHENKKTQELYICPSCRYERYI